MAIENTHISTDIVEIQEFIHLAQRYEVFGVPKVVLNENISFEGALPESAFLLHILGAVGQLTDAEKEQLESFKR